MKLELLYIYKQRKQRCEGVATERERVHLLFNIFNTAPVFHLDTSELNTATPKNTTCTREKGAIKKREDQPNTNNNKSTVSTTQNRTC